MGSEVESLPGRLRWRCRRGMKELDVVLLRYLDTHWPSATPPARAAFARLLELPDPQLAAGLLRGEASGDTGIDALLAAMRAESCVPT